MEKLNAKVENTCGAFIAQATAKEGMLTLHVIKRYNHSKEPVSQWNQLLELTDTAKAYETSTVVLKGRS